MNLCKSLGKQISFKEKNRENCDGYSKTKLYLVIERKGYIHGNAILDIKSTGKQKEMQCIKVSNKNHLYITDDYINTHNTTTSTLLAQNLISKGLKNILVGVDSISLQKGLTKATKAIINELKSIAQPIKNPVDIASISANDKEIGKIIGKTLKEIGKEGVIDTEEGVEYGVKKEIINGMLLNAGYESPYMITDPRRMEAVIKQPYILVTDRDLSSLDELKPILKKAIESGKKEIFIICNSIEGAALAVIVQNKMQGNIKAAAIKSPGFGDDRKEQLQDIAAMVDAKIISKDTGMRIEETELEHLGYADKVIVRQYETVIIGAKGNVKSRIKHLREAIKKETKSYRKEQYEKRLARLTGGVAVLKLGAPTEAEMLEMKYRVEDAVYATKAAMQDGIVPGGGIALIRASKILDTLNLNGDEKYGAEILKDILFEPLKQICKNAGIEWHQIIDNVLKSNNINYGYDIVNNKYGDMIKMGIVDPVKVTISALQNATSIANLVLSTFAIVVNKPEKKGNK